MIHKILRWDIAVSIGDFWSRHKKDGTLLFFLFLVNILIYAQRLFFYMLPSDDYMRFGGDTNTKMLITNSARWAQALLNDYVFVGQLQILPYLHPLIGIGCFTLMGYMTARYWKRTDTVEVALVTLLISATPMFAHNVLFATNITAWLTMTAGIAGFLWAHRKGFWPKAGGFALLVIAIANYQTIVQVLAMMVAVRVLFDTLRASTLRRLFRVWRYALTAMGYTLAAYIVSFWINELFLAYHHWYATHRLAHAHVHEWSRFVSRLVHIYTQPIDFNFFQRTFHTLYALLALSAVVSVVRFIGLTKDGLSVKAWKLFSVLLVFGIVPVIVKLPQLVGMQIPLRAFFPIGWATAGALSLAWGFGVGLIRSVTFIIAVGLLTVNIYYITLFFDAAYRQTQADIARARTIVERIRSDKEYQKEPIGFYILGQKPFSVEGWRLKWQQPFDSFWARYPLFRHFTDLRFGAIPPKRMREMQRYIATHYDHVDAYPGKNSIVVYKNNAILILNPSKFNAMIAKERRLAHFPDKKPDIRNVFDLYVSHHTLFYRKDNCRQSDKSRRFFLRIYPKNKSVAFEGKTRILPFQNMDFRFKWFGKEDNGSCMIAVPLPSYEIEKIRTGQVEHKDIVWESSVYLNHNRR